MLKRRRNFGIGVTLPFRRGNSGYFESSTEILPQIKSNFKNLIMTRIGERLGQPEFGCRIWEYIFEQWNPDTVRGVRDSVIDAVDRWMPFLELLQIDIQSGNDNKAIDNHTINLYVRYRIRENADLEDEIVIPVSNFNVE
jgi:phage baseplate assembly protein W